MRRIAGPRLASSEWRRASSLHRLRAICLLSSADRRRSSSGAGPWRAVATVPTSATGPSPSDRAERPAAFGERRRRRRRPCSPSRYVAGPGRDVRAGRRHAVRPERRRGRADRARHRPVPAGDPVGVGVDRRGASSRGASATPCGSAYTLAGDDPFPSPADALLSSRAYPLVAAGLVVGIRWRTPRTDLRVLVDAAIVAVSAATIGWIFVVETWNAEGSGFDALRRRGLSGRRRAAVRDRGPPRAGRRLAGARGRCSCCCSGWA